MGKLVPIVVEKLKSIHPELTKKESLIVNVINESEKEYFDLLEKGDATIDRVISKLTSTEKLFPTEAAIHLLHYLGYPRNRFYSKLHTYNKIVDSIKVDQYFTDKYPSQTKANQTEKKAQHLFDNVVAQTLSSLKVSKTEQVLQSRYQFNQEGLIFTPISVEVVAIIDNFGKVIENEIMSNKQMLLLLDKSCFIHPQGFPLPYVAEIRFPDGTICKVDKVINVQNWILHQVSCKNDNLPRISAGYRAYLCAVTDQWLPMLRSYDAATIAKKVVNSLASDKSDIVQKIKFEADKFIMELSGSINVETLLEIENAVNDSICNDENVDESKLLSNSLKNTRLFPSEIISFVIVKHRQQGKSRTILHCVTGFRAKECDKAAANLQLAVSDVTKQCNEIVNKSVDDLNILHKQVGILSYKSTKSEINAVTKAEIKRHLMLLSGKLNTLRRKLKKKELVQAH